LPDTVQSVMITLPLKYTPPPKLMPLQLLLFAELPDTVQRSMASVPVSTYTPPPPSPK